MRSRRIRSWVSWVSWVRLPAGWWGWARAEHERADDLGFCGDVQGVAGAVVEPADDFGVVVGGERVVGEV